MSYNANDIKTLDFRTAVRERVAMYMGSADNLGVLQCIREIITNSIDEATMGYGNKIVVELLPNNLVRITDEGRGCPFGTREDGTEALEAIYTMAHSGGKFDEKLYQNVAGQNGIGAKGTALSSDYFKVISRRDGKQATLVLDFGFKTSFEVVPCTAPSGTIVEFIPSPSVYNLEPISINLEDVQKMCRDWSYLMKGLTFIVKADKKTYTYCSKEGLADFLKDNGKKSIHKTILRHQLEEDNIKVEVVAEWTSSRSEEWHVFTNGLENAEGGTSLTGVKTALTNFFKKKIKGDGSPDIFRKGLCYAVSCQIPNPSFANQTKTKINNPELRGLCQRATTKMLENFENQKAEEFNKIMELLTKELKAEQAAERARKQVLEAGKEVEKNQKKKVTNSDKLKDAEYFGQESTLLLVEGNSALGGMSQGRDYKRYGLLALKGKIINCLSNPDEKIYQNDEIKLILSAMNIVPGRYDGNKLKYGRIGICTDADSDGYHIGLLIMAALYHICPKFIEEGRLYWLRAPLYIVTNGAKRSYYFTDKELEDANPKGEIKRNKGLGQMNPDEVAESMFGSLQRFDQLILDDESIELLTSLMGEDANERTEFIFNNVDFAEIRE